MTVIDHVTLCKVKEPSYHLALEAKDPESRSG